MDARFSGKVFNSTMWKFVMDKTEDGFDRRGIKIITPSFYWVGN